MYLFPVLSFSGGSSVGAAAETLIVALCIVWLAEIMQLYHSFSKIMQYILIKGHDSKKSLDSGLTWIDIGSQTEW